MFSLLGMAIMKENKGKEVVDEATRPGVQSQTHPSTGDKRKSLPKTLDFGNLSSRRGKKAKHRLSKPKISKSNLPPSQPSIQIVDIDSSIPADSPAKTIVPPLSKTTAPTSSQPSQRIPMNKLKNEDLAWERFEKAVTGEDVAVCYDMSLKEFEHSSVHDLFKVLFYLVLFLITHVYFTNHNFLITCRPCQSS